LQEDCDFDRAKKSAHKCVLLGELEWCVPAKDPIVDDAMEVAAATSVRGPRNCASTASRRRWWGRHKTLCTVNILDRRRQISLMSWTSFVIWQFGLDLFVRLRSLEARLLWMERMETRKNSDWLWSSLLGVDGVRAMACDDAPALLMWALKLFSLARRPTLQQI
jgi:hypothetical protein